MRAAALAIGFCLLARPSLVRAEAPAWLRSENRNVREGNQKLATSDSKAALAAYDRAARELPSEGGVHLDRGLALLRAGDLAAAREALKLATRPPASTAVRADAYYDLGSAFYKEADGRAKENKHDEAQQLFREASDAFKQSLRLRPNDRSSAWNYELAARRITEQQEKQKQKDQQDQNKDKQQGKDKQQDPQQGKDKQQDPQQGKDKQQDPQKQEPQAQKQSPKDKPAPSPEGQQPKPTEQPQPPAVRPEVDRALDALQDGEENLERLRAMNRAAREQRKPEKDW
jgi:Ca-activated chloride channel family protein